MGKWFCCSKCKYKEEKRVADISIGDFWGLKSSQDNMFKGISVILVNTDKGRRYLSTVKDKLYLEPHTYAEVFNGNRCLRVPAPMGAHRAEFFEQMQNMDFERLIWKLLGEKKLKLFLREMRYNLKESIKRMIGRQNRSF